MFVQGDVFEDAIVVVTQTAFDVVGSCVVWTRGGYCEALVLTQVVACKALMFAQCDVFEALALL